MKGLNDIKGLKSAHSGLEWLSQWPPISEIWIMGFDAKSEMT